MNLARAWRRHSTRARRIRKALSHFAPRVTPRYRSDTNGFILYGKGGEFATNRREDQEITMLSLHLLQLCLVYINTLMMQRVLSEPQWQGRMQPEDLRALTPLVYSHVTPYGTFRLDMSKRLDIEQAAA